MLNPSDSEAFARDGFVRFPRVIEPAETLADGVWTHLGGRGILRDDPATWPSGSVHHLQGIGAAPELDRGYAVALDAVLGAARWTSPKSRGQIVATFPERKTWTLPTQTWHTDAPYTEPFEPVLGALMLVLLEPVEAGGGGTLLLAGSHRLAARFGASRSTVGTEKMAVTRRAFFRSHPWLTALVRDDSDPEARMKHFSTEADIEDLPVRVVEIIGDAGDIVVAHPLMVHCTAPNCGDRPRIMRVVRPRVTVNGSTNGSRNGVGRRASRLRRSAVPSARDLRR